MPLPAAVRYRRVTIRSWDAHCAAGDAAATYTSWQAGHSHLSRAEDGYWYAPATVPERPGHSRLLSLALTAAEKPAQHLVRDHQPPWINVAASKGDTGAWLTDPTAVATLHTVIPGMLAPQMARALGWRFICGGSPVAACSTGLYALLAAADAIEYGLAEQALTGAADSSRQDLLVAGFARLGVMARERPGAFDQRGTGFALGEGAGIFALAADSDPAPGSWQVVAGVRAGDASHATRCADPSVLDACLQALWQVCPNPDLIVTHGTGTRAGDAYEGNGLDNGPWRHCQRAALKPLIGHCLGASAAIELAACLHAPVTSMWKLGLGFGGHIAGVALRRA
ncbi:MAG: beta-ketoacyl synthase N-terminal-like domain-containing protein [Planctomycetota bacterium]|jgi:hypothetical protein